MESAIVNKPWSQQKLIAFRFFFTYFLLHTIPFPLSILALSVGVLQHLTELFGFFYEGIANAMLDLDYKRPQPTGSGDTLLNYIQLGVFFTISLLSAGIWSLVDRGRTNYERLLYWLFVVLRYYLAAVLIGYGFAKIFKTQFPFPSEHRLYQSYGDSSPMGLLWTFMGYSTVYNVFIGLSEAIGGALVLFRRTRLIGAMVIIAVMSHVVILNFAYDVPVKLFSTHLLVMSIFLILPDLTRLVNFFILNEAIEPLPVKPIYHNIRSKQLYVALKSVVIATIVAASTMQVLETRRMTKNYYATTREGLSGEFAVESFTLNGKIVLPGQLDTRRWKKIQFKNKEVNIQYMDETAGRWQFNKNADGSKMIIHSNDLWSTGQFKAITKADLLSLEGTLDQDSLRITLRKQKANSFLLVDRGFHWVSEHPFNR